MNRRANFCVDSDACSHEEPTTLPIRRFVMRKVFILTHEATKLSDSDDYFAKKFSPLVPLFIISRSYVNEPKCDPSHTLFDCWQDRFVYTTSTDRNIIRLHALSVIAVRIDMDL